MGNLDDTRVLARWVGIIHCLADFTDSHSLACRGQNMALAAGFRKVFDRALLQYDY